MNRYALILFAFVVAFMNPASAYPEQCADIEYAELKEMTRKSFDEEYCRVTLSLQANIKYAAIINTRKDWKDVESCDHLSNKMRRVYEKRFGTTPKICTESGQREKAKEVWPDRIVDP